MLNIYNYFDYYTNFLTFLLLLGISLLVLGLFILFILKKLIKSGKINKDIEAENNIKSNYNQIRLFIMVVIGFSLMLFAYSLFNIPIIYSIKKDINNNCIVEENNGIIYDIRNHGTKVIIGNQIYYIRDYDYDIVTYHIDNNIEVKFYYYKYSKCIQYIEWQEIPEENAETG